MQSESKENTWKIFKHCPDLTLTINNIISTDYSIKVPLVPQKLYFLKAQVRPEHNIGCTCVGE